FQKVDRGAVLFWPAPKTALERPLKLRLFSIAAFQRDAEARGFSAVLEGLPPPQATDVRPPALVDLDRPGSKRDAGR
ncbi:MAG: hypothetical protein ACRC1K_01440, partial [Planctomycetia bacterium]